MTVQIFFIVYLAFKLLSGFRCVTHLYVKNFIHQEMNHKVHKEETTKGTESSPCTLCKIFMVSVVEKSCHPSKMIKVPIAIGIVLH